MLVPLRGEPLGVGSPWKWGMQGIHHNELSLGRGVHRPVTKLMMFRVPPPRLRAFFCILLLE
uniref:Uncharacterized protein n=1 Tax=Physcomitrium patens TaxID=3218 RepID=A0A2K1IED5_PHYPA|nr:hypothetical protein PHYPA_029789 [Physcomitrium patens]